MQSAPIPSASSPARVAAPLPPLDGEVNARRREIRPEIYNMAVGELVSLYENGDLDVQPRFQRFFRWTDEQKTALIESMMLGIPLPQIFLSARDDQVWEVVDGLQRMSTIFQFMGKLRDNDGEKISPLQLGKAVHLPHLDGQTWETLSLPMQRLFRHAKLSVTVLGAESSPDAKYDLFERLNTGGTRLSPQEIRNCILIMENEEFHEWLAALASDEKFQECVVVSKRLVDEQYHMELASRLLILSTMPAEKINRGMGDIGQFVTRQMTEMAKQAKGDKKILDKRAEVFHNTFKILADPAIGDCAFRRYYPKDKRFKGAFASSSYEAVACGIAHHMENGVAAANFRPDDVRKKIERMGEDDNFWGISTGRSPAVRLSMTIPYGRNMFKP